MKDIKIGSSIIVCARTAATWAEQYIDIQQAVISRDIHFHVIIADDHAARGTDTELGAPDVASSVEKFKLIAVPAESPGEFRLSCNRIFLPLSYVSWQPPSEATKAFLIAGAGLDQAIQRSILLTAPDLFLTALKQVFAKVVAGSRLEFRCGGKTKKEVEVPKARTFIVSSRQSLVIAHEVQQSLQHIAEVTVWNQGVFSASYDHFLTLRPC